MSSIFDVKQDKGHLNEFLVREIIVTHEMLTTMIASFVMQVIYSTNRKSISLSYQ